METIERDRITGAQRLREMSADLSAGNPDGRLHVATVARMLSDLAGCYRADARESFDNGFQMGAKIEHDAAVRAVAQAALAVLGKERADGVIDLGAMGRYFPPADPSAGDGILGG